MVFKVFIIGIVTRRNTRLNRDFYYNRLRRHQGIHRGLPYWVWIKSEYPPKSFLKGGVCSIIKRVVRSPDPTSEEFPPRTIEKEVQDMLSVDFLLNYEKHYIVLLGPSRKANFAFTPLSKALFNNVRSIRRATIDIIRFGVCIYKTDNIIK